MSSAEVLLISKIIEEQSFDEVAKANVRADFFHEPWDGVFSWITEYWQKHSVAPTERAFRTEFGSLSLEDARAEPFSGLIEEVKRNYSLERLRESIAHSAVLVKNGDLEGVTQELADGLRVSQAELVPVRYTDIAATAMERYDIYKQLAENRDKDPLHGGIPTGFDGLDNITFGLRPQQLITVVGEAKKGKSLFSLLIARAAHRHGVVPMYVSFEMSYQELASRNDAIAAKVPYGNVLTGNLTKRELDAIRQQLVLSKNQQPFIVVEDTSSLTTVSSLSALVHEHKPNVLFVDGVYMMDDEHGEPKGSPRALTNITRGLKRLAQKYEIPLVATTQVLSWKLGNKSSRTITGDAIGYSSSFVQDSDLVLGVESDPEAPDNQSIIRVVLARAAAKGQIKVNWDWSTMTFSEVGDEDEDGDDDAA